MFSGISVSRGVAIGPVHLLQRDQIEITESTIPKRMLDEEVARFEHAVDMARIRLEAVKEKVPENAPADISAFIETHLLMLNDVMLTERTMEIIREQQCNAEWALKQQRDALVAVFEAMEDPYLRTRRDDIDHVVQCILKALQPIEDDSETEYAPPDWSGQVVVADDLTPADTIVMQHQGVAGFVTESGGQLSHTAILARSLGIPAIVGVHDVRRYLRQGEEVILDGAGGMLLATPTEEAVTHYRRQQRALRKRQRALAKLRDAESRTLCGEPIQLMANIEVEEDIRALRKVNADGVGLYRTEFMYMNRDDYPGEEEHYKTYSRVVRALKGAPLTIRTADLGADKLTGREGPLAHNPALGLRGIRRSLSEPAMFVPQLRAILRAAAKGPIRILYPMLTNVAELQQVLTLQEEVKNELKRQKFKIVEDNIRVGAMIEVPSSAICARMFARRLDFLSIGTNDLIQYTLALDRIDDQVNYLYEPLHPAVLQLIRLTIEAGEEYGIPVSMCGEMAGDPRYTRLLLALGLRQFSMPPNLLLEVKQVITHSQLDRLSDIANEISNCSDALTQQGLLEILNNEPAEPLDA